MFLRCSIPVWTVFLFLYTETVLCNLVSHKVFQVFTICQKQHLWLADFIQRVTVSGSISRWRSLMSGGLRGPYWDQYCLISLLMTQTVGSSALSKSADDTELGGRADRTEGRNDIHRDLTSLKDKLL